MVSRVVTLRNESGLHARPATTLVQLAAGLQSHITLENLDRPASIANAKSIIEVLTLGASSGHQIRIVAEGPDEIADLDAIVDAIVSGLGEGAVQSG